MAKTPEESSSEVTTAWGTQGGFADARRLSLRKTFRSSHVTCARSKLTRASLSCANDRPRYLPPFLEVGPSLPVCREREKEGLFPYQEYSLPLLSRSDGVRVDYANLLSRESSKVH